MRKVDELEDSVDHRIAKGDQGVHDSQLEAVQGLLEKILYGFTILTKVCFPPSIFRIAASS